ncbi:hypothetical protein RCOM_0694440 [Ricinus communis]|uniref:Reverse transcriptase zinc-binding domain-containing protein n=1 Tax=Ricinus communis TaxID=3988 RepID=B9S861_RICCO|nr:hypothetical protein RCOM_0694440 [Ricinus communis]
MAELLKYLWEYGGYAESRISRLLTTAERKQRHLVDHDVYQRCSNGVETVLHALRDCDFSMSIWCSLVHPSNWSVFFTLPLDTCTFCYSHNPISAIVTKAKGFLEVDLYGSIKPCNGRAGAGGTIISHLGIWVLSILAFAVSLGLRAEECSMGFA